MPQTAQSSLDTVKTSKHCLFPCFQPFRITKLLGELLLKTADILLKDRFDPLCHRYIQYHQGRFLKT